jgi:hypothetical protein
VGLSGVRAWRRAAVPGRRQEAAAKPTRHPSKDTADAGEHIAGLVVVVAAASGTVGDPCVYGQAVAAELLPDLLPYVIGTPATYGFAVRNGRPLADNAPEVMLSLVTGTAIRSGLKPAATGHLRTHSSPRSSPTSAPSKGLGLLPADDGRDWPHASRPTWT